MATTSTAATLSTSINFKIMEFISYIKSRATRTRVVFYTVGILISIGFWSYLFGVNDKSLTNLFVFNSLWPGLLGFSCLFSLGAFVDRSVFISDSGDLFGDNSQSAKRLTTLIFLTLSIVSVAISFAFEASIEIPVRTGMVIQTISFCLASIVMFFGREIDQTYF